MVDNPFKRDDFGRFAPGGPGGPGRSGQAAKRDAYLAAFQQAISTDDLIRLGQHLLRRAIEDSDKDASALICRYLLPAPARTDDGDTPGGAFTAEAFTLLRAQLKAELQAEMAPRPDDWHPRKKLLDE
jgi:hypothetical protein